MAKVHDIGTHFFWHSMKYPGGQFPLFDRGVTREIDEPFRLGVSKVIRFPFTRKALVLGLWKARLPEGDALREAIGARALDGMDDNIWSDDL
jgi:hypothetical protein